MSEQLSLLNGRYQLHHEIARGGMATVWEAEDTALGREVAIKLLHPQLAADPEFLERFRREARAAARLSQPNIVAIYDIGEDASPGTPFSGTPYIVMELVDGPNLKDLIRQQGALPPAEIRRIGADLASALAFAHQRGVVHRDVKPQNILLGADGRPHLADFGIAQALAASGLTRAGTVMGSVHYLAPELLRGGVATPSSDIYSLGAVLYEMATGRMPFTGETDAAVAMAHLQQTPVPPHQLNPNLPPDLERTILQALAKAPEQRFLSADDLSRALIAPAPANGRGRPPLPGPADEGATGATVAMQQPTVPLGTRRSAVQARPVAPPRRTRAVPPPPQSSGGGGFVVLLAVLGALLILIAAGYFGFSLLGLGGAGGQTAATPTALPSPTLLVIVPPSPSVPVVAPPPTQTQTPTRRPVATPTRTALPSPTPSPPPATATAIPATPTPVSPNPTPTLLLPTPLPAVAVPNVVGQSTEQAQALLRSAGLLATVHGVNTNAPQGTVVAQVPAAGAPQVPNGVVTLSVATGNVAVPDVAGRIQVDATTLLTQAGLQVQRVQQASDPRAPAGSAIGTTPAAGTLVPRGSGVTLTISAGRP